MRRSLIKNTTAKDKFLTKTILFRSLVTVVISPTAQR